MGDAPFGVRASNSSGHAGQTLRDVVGTQGSTEVEGAHRELRSGLADRLGRDDADGLADVDELAGRERAAVAGGADADRGLAGQHRAHLDGLDARLEQLRDRDVAGVVSGGGDDLALGVERVLGEACARTPSSRRSRRGPARRRRPSPRSRSSRPLVVPQSSSRMMTSCETSTRRRVRYPESAVRRAVSARPLRAPWVAMKYSATDSPSRYEEMIGRGMVSPFGFDTRPRIPAMLRTCSQLPRAPDDTIR